MPAKDNADTTVTHPLQAVVLADSFTRTFRPMSLEQPKVLSPIANSPMIEYTLEMLANAKVKEIIVVCCWHAEKVAEYVRKSRWQASKNPVVRIVSFPSADSAGTALRELAGMAMIQSDPFILISGDVVSNVRLGPILRAHMARKDSNQLMTMVFRKTSPGNPLRNLDDDLVVAMNAETKQLLMYETAEGEPDEENDGELSLKLGKDARFFIDNPKLEIRQDLLDCHIDICSPEVFHVLEDEFYEDLRLGMIRKEVANPEFGRNFYVHELTMPQDYAARVHCIRSYDQVSKDVIGRWLYPLTPDNNWCSSDGGCWFTRGFMYREQNVSIDRTASIGRCTMLGADSMIGENATVEHSVIGRKVVIGPNAKVTGSYVWDKAVIGAGVTIDRAVICNDAVIGDGATIMRGAIVSFGVVVEPNATVLPFTRLTKADPYVDERNSWEQASEELGGGGMVLNSTADATTAANVNLGSKDVTFQVAEETEEGSEAYREYTLEEEDFDGPELPAWAEKALDEATGIWKVSKSMVIGSMGCEELERARKKRTWFAPSAHDDHHGGIGSRNAGLNANSSFRTMEESCPSQVAHLLGGFLTKNPESLTSNYFSDLSMELKGLRASTALSFADIVAVSFAVLMQTVLADFKEMTPQQIKTQLVSFVQKSTPLLTNFTKNILNQGTAIQVGLIQSAEMCCLIGPSLAPQVLLDLPEVDYKLENAIDEEDVDAIVQEHGSLRAFFPVLLLLFVTNDIIELPALQKWFEDRTNQVGTLDSHFLDVFKATEKQVAQLIEKLEQQEEEESEDDDDDDDDEGEEE